MGALGTSLSQERAFWTQGHIRRPGGGATQGLALDWMLPGNGGFGGWCLLVE